MWIGGKVMITVVESKAKLQFGSGDISIIGSAEIDTNIGYLSFVNQASSVIGSSNDLVGDDYHPEKHQVVMTFTKTESIDALVLQLQNIKENMLLNDLNKGRI